MRSCGMFRYTIDTNAGRRMVQTWLYQCFLTVIMPHSPVSELPWNKKSPFLIFFFFTSPLLLHFSEIVCQNRKILELNPLWCRMCWFLPLRESCFCHNNKAFLNYLSNKATKKKKKKDRGNEYDTQVWRMWEKLSKKGFGSRYFEKKVFSCENIEFREKCSTEIKPDGEAYN